MRVAYVGNFGPEWSTENDVRLALTHLGHEVVPLQENAIDVNDLRAAAVGADLLLWTSTWDHIALRDAVDVFHECATRNIPTATLHLDVFWGTGREGRPWWREAMFHTSHLFTADGDHQGEWEKLGKRHTWLPPGVRHSAACYGTRRPEFECDVAFVGSNGHGYHEDVWQYRRQVVDAVRDMCQRNGWRFRNPGGDEAKVGRGDMNDFYASAAVTVGDSLCPRRKASHYWSDRAYEAPGRGGFLIMPEIDALEQDYDGLLPSYRWGDFGHLEEQVRYFLENEDVRLKTRHQCHEIAKAQHTYVNRVESMLSALQLDQAARKVAAA